MEGYPKTLLEFEQRFASEEACRQYLCNLRWPDGFRCPRCQHDKAWLTRRTLYHCVHCGYETSVTAGTIFQDTRKPLQLWFRALWYVVNQKNGVSAMGLQRILGIPRYDTVWIWLHKIRTAMVRPGRDRLSGTVEVDETYIGGKRPGKGGAVQRVSRWSLLQSKIKTTILVVFAFDGYLMQEQRAWYQLSKRAWNLAAASVLTGGSVTEDCPPRVMSISLPVNLLMSGKTSCLW